MLWLFKYHTSFVFSILTTSKERPQNDRGGGSVELACEALVLDVCLINETNIRGLNVRVYIYKIEDLNVVAGNCS